MVLEDLVVQGLWWFHGRRHGVCGGSGRTRGSVYGSQSQEKVSIEARNKRDSARAAIGLNEAQTDLKSQRQSRNKKLQADVRSQRGAGRVVESQAD
jgi:hypothetical protein